MPLSALCRHPKMTLVCPDLNGIKPIDLPSIFPLQLTKNAGSLVDFASSTWKLGLTVHSRHSMKVSNSGASKRYWCGSQVSHAFWPRNYWTVRRLQNIEQLMVHDSVKSMQAIFTDYLCSISQSFWIIWLGQIYIIQGFWLPLRGCSTFNDSTRQEFPTPTRPKLR